MKVEIYAPINPSRGYTIHSESGRLKNRNGNMFPEDFSEDEVAIILGEKYQSFEDGRYMFNLPVWKIKAIQGLNNPQNNEQIKFSLQYSEL